MVWDGLSWANLRNGTKLENTVMNELYKLFSKQWKVILVTLFLGMVVGVNTPVAQETRPNLTEEGLLLAQQLMATGRYAETLQVLQSHRFASDHFEAIFLVGLASVELSLQTDDEKTRQKLLVQAVTAFRTILNDDPNLMRVRLELARTFFLQNKDSLAREQFERVLAGNPPPAVQANIEGFLETITNRRRWRGSLSGQLVWESNHNSGTKDPTVLFFGLPFNRNDATPETAMGVLVSARGSYRYPYSDRLALDTSIGVARTEYPGSRFDSTVLDFAVGPEFQVGTRNLVGVQGLVIVSRNPGSPYHKQGGQVSFRHLLDNRTRVGINLGFGKRIYRETEDKVNNANEYDTGITVDYRLTPTITVNGGVSFSLSDTPDNRAQKSKTIQLHAGISSLLKNGLTVGFATSYSRKAYEGQPGFPTRDSEPRMDRFLTLQATMLHREFTIRGFSPQLALIHDRLTTNAQASDFQNTRMQVTMVSQF